MKKPQAKNADVYDFLSIASYVNEKYKLGLSDNELWHWFVDTYEPDNGTQISFDTAIDEDDKNWVKDLKQNLEVEFGSEINLLIQW